MNIKTIEEAFAREGYISILFSFNGVGQPLIKATIANVEASFLIDTGAAVNLLDFDFAKELNLNQTSTGEQGGGAGGLTYEVFSLGEISLDINGQHFKFDSFYSMDFTSIKHALTSRGVMEEIHVILGFGFFQMTKCFIDYSANRIFILNN